jgi:hypothetical protein
MAALYAVNLRSSLMCCTANLARADSVSTAAAHYTGNASGNKASAKATPLLMAWAVMLAST